MEQSYKEKYEDILARLERAKNDNEVCDERFCCVINEIIPELAESEDEKVRKEIINYFQCQSEEEPTRKEIHNKWIAWLEKQELKSNPYSGVSFNYNGNTWGMCARDNGVDISCDKHLIKHLEKQGEQKIEENKGNIEGISPKWSVEDEENFCSVYLDVKSARQNTVNSLSGELKEQEQKRMDEVISWLRSLKGRVLPKQEWTEEEIEPIISDYLCGREHYGGMIGRLCHLKPKQKQTKWGEDDKAFLDDILCKLEHDLILNKDEKDWLKSLRPQNRWKPSDEQIAQLQIAVDTYGNEGIYDPILTELLFQLKKLKEGKV